DMRNPERTVEALKPSNPTWLWMDSSGARPPIPAPLADPFGFRWRFDHGSSKDFRLVNGNWFHVPGKPGFLAGMQMPDTSVILPAEVPQRPVVLSMKIRFARPAQANAMTVSAGWTKDNAAVPFSSWWRETRVPTPWLVSCYFADRWQFLYV